MSKKFIAIIALSAIASTHVHAQPKLNESTLRDAFSDAKDPASIQFRGIKYSSDTPGAWKMCGEFNAKNSFGGYVGFQPFSGVALTDPKTKKTAYFVFGTGDVADAVCRKDGLR